MTSFLLALDAGGWFFRKGSDTGPFFRSPKTLWSANFKNEANFLVKHNFSWSISLRATFQNIAATVCSNLVSLTWPCWKIMLLLNNHSIFFQATRLFQTNLKEYKMALDAWILLCNNLWGTETTFPILQNAKILLELVVLAWTLHTSMACWKRKISKQSLNRKPGSLNTLRASVQYIRTLISA